MEKKKLGIIVVLFFGNLIQSILSLSWRVTLKDATNLHTSFLALAATGSRLTSFVEKEALLIAYVLAGWVSTQHSGQW